MDDNYPKYVIIKADDLIDLFMQDVAGIFNRIDLNEIMTQVISMLLNDDSGVIEYSDSFPDYTRLIDHDFLNDEKKIVRLDQAVNVLVTNVYERLKENGLFCDNSFPYFFDRFLGTDIVLHHLPY